MNPCLTKAEKLVLVGNKVMLTLAQAQVNSCNLSINDWTSAIVSKSSVIASDFYKSHNDSNLGYEDNEDSFERMLCPETKIRSTGTNNIDIHIIKILTLKLAQITGFKTGTLLPGRNYYKSTLTLVNDQGVEVGSVNGGGNSQKGTFNIILRGTGCTFANPCWRQHLYDFLVPLVGELGRVDIALDFFLGGGGGVQGVRDAYLDGKFDYNGRRPASTHAGSWDHGHSRTYNIGNRGSKSFTAYEKSHAYGIMDGTWWRAELRYGSRDRILPLEILIEPDKYFAGGYPYLAQLLDSATPEIIKTKTALVDMTVDAILKRKMNWFENTVAPSLVHFTAAFDEGQHGFMWLCDLAVKHAYRDMPKSLRDVPAPLLKLAIQKMLSPHAAPASL